MSNNLDLTLLVTGQDDPETSANDKGGEIDAAMTEEIVLDTSSANVTISSANYRRAISFKITGDNDIGRTVTLPAVQREATFYNAETVSRSIIKGSTTITLAAGKALKVYTDGTTDGLRSVSGTGQAIPVTLTIAASDEATAITATPDKVKFRMPHSMTVSSVRASLSTAQTSGSTFTVDIHESGTTILSTKITIDNTHRTSTTAGTPPVVSDTALADDAEIIIDVDQIGDGTAKGLKVTLIGTSP